MWNLIEIINKDTRTTRNFEHVTGGWVTSKIMGRYLKVI